MLLFLLLISLEVRKNLDFLPPSLKLGKRSRNVDDEVRENELEVPHVQQYCASFIMLTTINHKLF